MPKLIIKKDILTDSVYKSLTPWHRTTLWELAVLCPISHDEANAILGDRKASIEALVDAGLLAVNPRQIVLTCQSINLDISGALNTDRWRERKLAAKKEEERKEEKLDTVTPCPYSDIKQLYSKHLPTLVQPIRDSAKREQMIKSRWREISVKVGNDTQRALHFFDKFFYSVSQSDFLMGRTSGPRVFTACNLDWLMKSENFGKVIEGNYKNREGY